MTLLWSHVTLASGVPRFMVGLMSSTLLLYHTVTLWTTEILGLAVEKKEKSEKEQKGRRIGMNSYKGNTKERNADMESRGGQEMTLYISITTVQTFKKGGLTGVLPNTAH